MNINQMKKILADAPDGATHYAPDENTYWIINSVQCDRFEPDYPTNGDTWTSADDVLGYVTDILRLKDLRTIVNQHEEIENLKGHILVLQRRIEALRERKNWGEIVSAEYYPYAMSDDELIELSKPEKENDNEQD